MLANICSLPVTHVCIGSLSTKRQSLARDDGNGIEVSKWANGKCYKIPPPAASHRAFHEYKNMLVTNRVVYGLKVWATNGLVFYSKRHKWNIPGEIDKKERFEGEFSHFPKNFQEKLLLEGNDDEVLDSFGFWTLDYGVEQDPLGRDWDLYWFLVHRGEDWLWFVLMGITSLSNGHRDLLLHFLTEF